MSLTSRPHSTAPHPPRGRVPGTQVRDIVAQTDMLAVVREVVEVKKSGASWKACCPFHNEKTPSFHVNPGLKLYHCYGCGAGGDVLRFVQETRGLAFMEALEYLADRLGITMEREAERPEDVARRAEAKSVRGRMLELDRAAQAWFRARLQLPDGKKARDYAVARGMTAGTIERFGLGAAGTGWTDLLDHLLRQGFAKDDVVAIGLAKIGDKGGTYDRFRDRLMFPIYTSAGDLVGFGGRDLSGDKETAKYLNSSEITVDGEGEGSRFKHFYKKGDCVFGLWQARESIRRSRLAILVEGNLDVMTLSQAGFENTVCAMGTALTDAQAKEIKRFADRVALVFDGDGAGRKAAMKSVPIVIGAGLEGVLVTLPDGEDPDSYVRKFGHDAFAELLEKAPPLLNGYIDALVAASDGSLQSSASILQKAGPLLTAIADPMARDMARDYLKSRLMTGTGLAGGHRTGASEAHEETFSRYLHMLAPSTPVVHAPVQTIPDATHGEPEIPAVERELAAVLAWYPALTPAAVQYQVLDLLQHAGLRLALRDLCALGRDQALDQEAVSQWAQGLPDGRARRMVLHGLMGQPLCKPEHAQAWLVQVAWKLQKRQLQADRDVWKQKLHDMTLPESERLEAMRQTMELDRQLTQFKNATAREALTVTHATRG